MLYVKIVIPIPVDGPFDYSVPAAFVPRVVPGMRALVTFGARKCVGYIVGVSKQSSIKNVKPIISLLDDAPILSKELLRLTKLVSQYYCCSWGEVIDTALPWQSRSCKKGLELGKAQENLPKTSRASITSLINADRQGRWDFYLNELRKCIDLGKQALILLPDILKVARFKERAAEIPNAVISTLFRKSPSELREWLKIRNREVNIIVGTRSAVFAPLQNQGLIIIDEETDYVYKQDQVPHYSGRQVAIMRAKLNGTSLILGSVARPLETVLLSRDKNIDFNEVAVEQAVRDIFILDDRTYFKGNTKKTEQISRYLQGVIDSTLSNKGSVLVYFDKKGFASYGSCLKCGYELECPRCSVNLVYYYEKNILSCSYCNYSIAAPRLCPQCNSDYIRYEGIGIEKVESQIYRLFPRARIVKLEHAQEAGSSYADIVIANKNILSLDSKKFDLVCVLNIDSMLSRIDFRSAEKTLLLLRGLLNLCTAKMIIQTSMPGHYVFKSLKNNNPEEFILPEMDFRKQLGFPPYKHLAVIKLRSPDENKVSDCANRFFEVITKETDGRSLEVLSLKQAQPFKIRGNFYWNIVTKGSRPLAMSALIKRCLKKVSHSGIIITIDMDPV
ncbi:MAG: primosomal protein N' [Candidatus Omnitrophota bacterium]|jgi:primosomal protein N' (replication factor Y)|nr:MAG: primosomal protein N' [Candidatus Omnitrophota bacterium]